MTSPRDEITERAGRVSYRPCVDTIGTAIPGSALSGGAIDHIGDDALAASAYDQRCTLTVP
ncbi:hypothetical protein [Streptomyces niveiscabiei]|uniref:Uncharacterized protein n=1 Tax=Streptomyces niveiscabiei TaxID=164115 RepID=A0ABW9HKM6_9ACTN